MPVVGFGTAGLGQATKEAVLLALASGYRLLDSAQVRCSMLTRSAATSQLPPSTPFYSHVKALLVVASQYIPMCSLCACLRTSMSWPGAPAPSFCCPYQACHGSKELPQR